MMTHQMTHQEDTMTTTEPDTEEQLDAERKLQHAEILVKDIHYAAQSLVKRLAALELYGIDSVQQINHDLATVAKLLALDAQQMVDMLVTDINEAATLFTGSRTPSTGQT